MPIARSYIDWISPHISYNDAVRSTTAARLGIKNVPTTDHLMNMQRVAANVYEVLWTRTGGRIRVNSFFRSPELNKAVGGAKNSQHMAGEAIDIDAIHPLTNTKLLELARRLPDFDQVVSEYGEPERPAWIHVSYRESGNRRQVLRIP